MSSRKKSKKTYLSLGAILLAIFAFVLGYFMLNHVATWEKIIPGPTFYIVFGCIFMAAAVLYVGRGIYKKYFEKKKKRRTKPVFLNKDETNTPI